VNTERAPTLSPTTARSTPGRIRTRDTHRLDAHVAEFAFERTADGSPESFDAAPYRVTVAHLPHLALAHDGGA
jgi:hypothetical protein